LKKIIFGIVSFAVMIFGYFFGVSFPNGFNLGDRILMDIGLKAWSDGTTGLHYTIFYSIILILLAWIGANKTLGKDYPKVTNIIPTVILILLFVTPIVLNL